MKKSKLLKLLAVAVPAIVVAADASAANTGSTEFQGLYNTLNQWVTGYFGKTTSVAAIGLGALFSLAKLNPMPILTGIGFAVFQNYAPTIVTGILTATV